MAGIRTPKLSFELPPSSGHLDHEQQRRPDPRDQHTVGHKSTHVTETVYRHVIVPAIRGGATVKDDLFGAEGEERKPERSAGLTSWRGCQKPRSGARSPKPDSGARSTPSTSGARYAKTATPKPRSPVAPLEIPDDVARALKEHHAEQAKQKLKAGKARQDNDMVFCTSVGTPLDAANVRRSFRRITKAAGLGECRTPRELRHSFVSIMSDNGVTIEQIADLVGHRTTIVTQKVYRHQLKPVISTGATAMNTIFGNKKSA
jgi:hypothetical protein